MNEEIGFDILIGRYANSLKKMGSINVDYLSNYINIVTDIDHFLGNNRKYIEDKYRKLYSEFLTFVYERINTKLINLDDFPNLKDLFTYKKLISHASSILRKESISYQNLKSIDSLFDNYAVRDYLSNDEKTLRKDLEMLLLNKLGKDGLGDKLVKHALESNLKMPNVLCVYLCLKYYKDIKHPAMIVTFYQEEMAVLESINLDFEALSKLCIEKDYFNYNLTILKEIYKKCLMFSLRETKEINEYDINLWKIIIKCIPECLKYSYYEIHSSLKAIEYINNLLDNELINIQSNKYITGFKNIHDTLYNSFYKVVEGVRTIDVHEKNYETIINYVEKEYNEKDKEYLLEYIKYNKYKQECDNVFSDDYLLNAEEVKRILLVAILEYSQNNVYSHFNSELMQEIVTKTNDELINKYMLKEYKKRLQELYITMNEKEIYTNEKIKNMVLTLPMNYFLLDKVSEFCNQIIDLN